MKKLTSLRKYLIFGAAGGLLLVMGMLLGTGFLTTANDNVNPAVVNADGDDDENGIAATYFVEVQNENEVADATAIITLTESSEGGSGTLLSQFSYQFPGGTVFHDEQGTWISSGEREIKAKSVNYSHNQDGELTGTDVDNYDISFSEDFQTIEGSFEGGGVDFPGNPLNEEFDFTFSGLFKGVRVNPAPVKKP